tara:strand:+ start:406 stop:867 length:462 start_codon:yes stop_codon:yes gene_type:complete
MAYDEGLAQRVRELLEERWEELEVIEKKMFGGLCFMVQGNMCCGILQDDMMVRVGAEGHADALAQPHARPMDFTGKAMKGMVYVGPEGVEGDDDLDKLAPARPQLHPIPASEVDPFNLLQLTQVFSKSLVLPPVSIGAGLALPGPVLANPSDS